MGRQYRYAQLESLAILQSHPLLLHNVHVLGQELLLLSFEMQVKSDVFAVAERHSQPR